MAYLGGMSFLRGEGGGQGVESISCKSGKFFNLSPIVVVSKKFAGAFLFVFLDDIALNQQTSFFLNFSFLFILFTFQLK